jgi:uncharacterized repeat protein (TIGR01451 family)
VDVFDKVGISLATKCEPPQADKADIKVSLRGDAFHDGDVFSHRTLGDAMLYNATIFNRGQLMAKNVRLTNTLTDQVDLGILTPSSGTCNSDGNCQLGNINAGSVATVDIIVKTSNKKDKNGVCC